MFQILWTVLSVAFGYELEGNTVQSKPYPPKISPQMICPETGRMYPKKKIMKFINNNKAMIRRMYAKFHASGPLAEGPNPDLQHAGETFFGNPRERRQAAQASINPPPLNAKQGNSSNRRDACEASIEVISPYWAYNSDGKSRALISDMEFEQPIQQEICSKTSTSHCSGDCGCKQKYMWHKLLSYDLDLETAGVSVDWFMFPSCCVCQCDP